MNKDHVIKTIAVYDQIANEYAQKINEYLPEPELKRFLSYLPPRATVLDAGCGPGRDCEYFVKHGLHVTGVDLSEKLLDYAKKRVPKARFFKQDLRRLDLLSEYFDGIWANASLHHLHRSDVSMVLKRFLTLLKPQGILYALVKRGIGEEDISESISSGLPRHYVYYQEQEFRNFLIDAGFVVEEVYTYREDRRRSGGSDLVWLASFSRKP